MSNEMFLTLTTSNKGVIVGCKDGQVYLSVRGGEPVMLSDEDREVLRMALADGYFDLSNAEAKRNVFDEKGV